MTASFSLKSVLPDLAPAFDMSPAALYERQRAMVREGWLSGKAGKGPGSGVQATPQSVALLIVSVLATDSLSEVEAEVRQLASLRILEETGRAEVGGVAIPGLYSTFSEERRFDRALEALLKSPTLTEKTSRIVVRRGQEQARIDFNEEEDGSLRSFLFGQASPRSPLGLLNIEASLGPQPLVEIASLIPSVCEEWWRDHPDQELHFLYR